MGRKHHLLQLCQQLCQQGTSVLMVLHDLNLAAQYADRILLLKQGKLMVDDTPAQALSAANIEHIYQWQVRVVPHPNAGYPVVMSR